MQYLKNSSVTRIISILFLFILQSCDQFPENKENRITEITANGYGSVLAEPDVIKFNYTIRKTDKNIDKALQNTNTLSNKVIEFLLKNSIQKDDIKTINYKIEPEYYHIPKSCNKDNVCTNRRKELIGYGVDHKYEVKVKNIKDIGLIISGITKLGVVNVSNLSFVVENQDTLEKKARSLAILNAKEDAKLIAKDLGVKIGKIINYRDNKDDRGPFLYKKTGFASSSNIMPGKNSIDYSVAVTFEIIDNEL